MKADARLAVPVAAAWAVVVALLAVPSAAPWAAAGLAAAALVCLAVGRRVRVGASVAVCLAIAALLATLVAVQLPQRRPPDLLSAARAGRHVVAVVDAGERVRSEVPFDGTATEVRIGHAVHEVRIPVTVFDHEGDAAPGSRVVVAGTLVAGAAVDRSAFRLFATSLQVRGPPPWWIAVTEPLRSSFERAASALPGDGGALLAGLAIGETSAVPASLDAAMKASSLTHLTAVSGANCAVVIGLALLVGARLGLPRRVRLGGALVLLVGFVCLVSPQPSVLRAATMAALALAIEATGRAVSGLPVLALAVLVLLCLDPWLAVHYGFALSVLATAGIVLLARPISARLERILPRWLALVVAVPLAAQLACQPILLMLQPGLPTYGVVANVLAEPAAPIATVVGLVACLLSAVWPGAGLVAAWIAWLPAAWIAAVARFFAGLPGATLPWPGGGAGVALLAVACVLVVVLVSGAGGRRIRSVVAGALLVTAIGVIGFAVGDAVRAGVSRPPDWQVGMCDVGQGDASLVRSDGMIAMIDTGREPARVTSCLSALGIGRIDLLVLTHYDIDHVGGTSALFGRVSRALVGPRAGQDDERLVRQLAEHGAVVEQAHRGMSGVMGRLRWEVLWPKERLGSVEPGNAASVTVAWGPAGPCPSGCITSLFLGDLGEQPQELLMAANRIGPVDLVKVAHHGSADQSPTLYERLRASVGLIGVGADNGYGHPTRRLLSVLRGIGTTIARTDEEGMLLVSPLPGGGESLWTERAPSDLLRPGRSRAGGRR